MKINAPKKSLQPKFGEELLLIWRSLEILERSHMYDHLQRYFIHNTVPSYRGHISQRKNMILTQTTAAECSPLTPGTDKTCVCALLAYHKGEHWFKYLLVHFNLPCPNGLEVHGSSSVYSFDRKQQQPKLQLICSFHSTVRPCAKLRYCYTCTS